MPGSAGALSTLLEPEKQGVLHMESWSQDLVPLSPVHKKKNDAGLWLHKGIFGIWPFLK